jgi:hypothetical protein
MGVGSFARLRAPAGALAEDANSPMAAAVIRIFWIVMALPSTRVNEIEGED